MDPLTIGALIGGATQLAGGVTSAFANSNLNKKNRQFNAKQAQLARDWQEDQYNKYSSPSAMVRQYEEAGLNPALVAGVGQGTTFTGSSASAPSSIPFGNLGEGVGDMIALIDSIRNNKSLRNLQQEQAETEDAKQRNLDSDTAGKNIENQFKPDILKQNLEQGKLNLENTRAGLKLAEKDLKLKDAEYVNRLVDTSRLFSVINNNNADTAKKIAETATERLRAKGQALTNDNLRVEYGRIVADTALKAASSALAVAQTDEVKLDVIEKNYKRILRDDHGFVDGSLGLIDKIIPFDKIMHYLFNLKDSTVGDNSYNSYPEDIN